MRFLLATCCGLVCYMIATVMTGYDGMVSMAVQPLMGLMLSAIASGVLLLGKLPLRYLPWLQEAWIRQKFAAPIIIVAGVVTMTMAWIPALHRHVESINPTLGYIGWLAMIFGILFYPPGPAKRVPRIRPGPLDW